MILLGVDFSSAPTRRKPLYAVRGHLEGARLVVDKLETLHDFRALDAFLRRPGPWLAGFDFPFGQPARVIEALGWPGHWPDMARHVGRLGRTGTRDALLRFVASQSQGHKRPQRVCDAASGGASPVNTINPPVGLMFAEGVPRLVASGVAIPGLREGDPERTVIETYPGVLARAVIGRTSYKGKGDTASRALKRDARRAILDACSAEALVETYGCRLEISDALRAQAEADTDADLLDSLLCLIQTAWASRQADYSKPRDLVSCEGWIADPHLVMPKPTPREEEVAASGQDGPIAGFNFAYLDEQTKRMIRRAILKAVAIPGYQVPFASRDMPLPYGWGTGGIQLTCALIGPDDVVKVIDQGADDTTNAVSIRQFYRKTSTVRTTERTEDATLIQTRHRVPETPLHAGQILIYQVPIPEPLRSLQPREPITRRMHANADYGLMYVRLYEDIARLGRIASTYDYPVVVNARYVMAPSPIPKFDNPKLHMNPALQLFGAGREKRIYALPPFTAVRSLDFEDYPFSVQTWSSPCALCGDTASFLDEVTMDDAGNRLFICSDTDHCHKRQSAGHRGPAFDDPKTAALRGNGPA